MHATPPIHAAKPRASLPRRMVRLALLGMPAVLLLLCSFRITGEAANLLLLGAVVQVLVGALVVKGRQGLRESLGAPALVL
jgi:hypothetical protein